MITGALKTEKAKVDLSVIIVNWNTVKFLDECLESIFKTTSGITFEVIVVDNDSKDGSVKMVREKYPRVHLIENRENVGFARANNRGIKNHITGTIIKKAVDHFVIKDRARARPKSRENFLLAKLLAFKRK